MNKSLLAKLGWQMIFCGEENWCTVFQDKYGVSDEGPVMFKDKQRASGIWHAIVWSSAMLRACL